MPTYRYESVDRTSKAKARGKALIEAIQRESANQPGVGGSHVAERACPTCGNSGGASRDELAIRVLSLVCLILAIIVFFLLFGENHQDEF